MTAFLNHLQNDLGQTGRPFDPQYYRDIVIRKGMVREALVKHEGQRLERRLASDGHLQSLYRRGTLLGETPAFEVILQYLTDHRLDKAITPGRLQDHGLLFEEALLALKRGSKTRKEYFEEFERERTLQSVLKKWHDPQFHH